MGCGAGKEAKLVQRKVEQAKKTRILGLRESNLQALPPLVEELDLKSADVEENRLTALPSFKAGMEILKAGNNRIITLPVLPQTLKQLHVQDNLLSALPEAFCTLALHTLDLSGNQLVCLELGGALGAAVQTLNVSGNGLGKLRIHGTQLRTLAANRNNLTLADLDLAGPKLQSLDLEANRLESLPAKVLESPLQDLRLKGNPVDKAQLGDLQGFSAFLERRKAVKDKQIAAGVDELDFSVCGL